MFYRWKNFLIVLLMAAILAGGAFLFFQKNKNLFERKAAQSTKIGQLEMCRVVLPPPPQKLGNPPEIIKAVYVTSYSASNQKYLNYLSSIFGATEINAVVIDIKDSSGVVFKPSDDLVNFFHDKNVYVIGRISVFEDPVYAKAHPELAIHDKNGGLWRDNNGLFWLDPASKDVWDYNISLAKNALFRGFDEINFDYIRFPSDGKTENMSFPFWDEQKPKQEAIKEFFEYLRSKLLGHRISADLFGQTTTNTDDMGIGQIIENAFASFDFVCPMLYPSHYANGFLGFSNPAEHPYEIIKYSLDSALARNIAGAKLRPWLQDFDMGADYTSDMVKAEIKAVEDALGKEYNGFMLWNPANIYTTQAVLKLN